jgi:SAM-dependent methyltransferase
MAMRYEDHDAPDDGHNTKNFIEALEVILPYCKRDSVLDLGCGNGRLSAVLSEHFKQVYAIDKDDFYEEQFKRDNVEYKQTVGPDIEKKVNLIILWASFYVMDKESALREIKEKLETNGILVICEDERRFEGFGFIMNDGLMINMEFLLEHAGLKQMTTKRIPGRIAYRYYVSKKEADRCVKR